MESLKEFIEFINPDAKIRVFSTKELFTGYARELINTRNPFLEYYDVMGCMFSNGILTIYIA